jgi:hypothetical protein
MMGSMSNWIDTAVSIYYNAGIDDDRGLFDERKGLSMALW